MSSGGETGISSARKAMQENEEEDLRSWVEGVGHQEMKFRVTRMSPKFHKGVLTKGFIANYEEPVYEDVIREQHGGGVYQIAVTNKRANGQWKYFTTRTVEIPGHPRIDNLRSEAEAEESSAPTIGGGGSDVLAIRAMDNMERQLNRANENKSNGFDPQYIQMAQAPLLAQLASLERAQQELMRQMAAKDAQILQLLTQKPEPPPPDTFKDKILGNMLENESVRLEAMRNRHESETRQLKEGFHQELNHIREAAKEEMRSRERQHERELDLIKESARNTTETQKTATEMRIDSLKSDNARLSGELGAAKVEIAELRAKKDKSLPEQAEELMKVNEAFKAIGIGGKSDDDDDDSDKPMWERMANRVLENPEAIGQMLGGVRGAISPPAAPQPQFNRKAAAAAAAVVAAKEGPKPPSPEEIAIAVKFMESAAMGGTDPAAFAASARSMIDGDTIDYLEKVGVDGLLAQVTLDTNSIFRSQQGRNWLRAVAKVLLEGV